MIVNKDWFHVRMKHKFATKVSGIDIDTMNGKHIRQKCHEFIKEKL